MNDRELLELAAKAIDGTINGVGSLIVLYPNKAHVFAEYWNPLADDGDALRLAVKLRLDVLFSPDVVEAMANTGAEIEPYGLIPYSGDDAKDTRRAIVRAAAEIGRGWNDSP